jgi:hypothetical protein
MNRPNRLRTASVLAAAAVLLGSLGACTSSQSGGGSTASSGAGTQSPATAAASLSSTPLPSDTATCTKSSIEGALPKGSVLAKFDCTIASPAMWAGARLESGSVFFLTSTAGRWVVTPGAEMCGARKSEVPPELSSYCG